MGVHQRVPLRAQGLGGREVQALDAHPAVGRSVLGNQGVQVPRPLAGLVIHPVGAGGKGHRGAGAHLGDGLQVRRQMLAAFELKQDHRAGRRQEQIAGRRAHGPVGHVARVGGVADVDRVDEDQGIDVLALHLGAHTLPPAQPHARQVHARRRGLELPAPKEISGAAVEQGLLVHSGVSGRRGVLLN